MSPYLQEKLQETRPLNQQQARLILRKLYLANEEIAMLQDYLIMADKGNGDINCACLPPIIRLLDRVMWAMTESSILLCPSIDPQEAKNQETLALHPHLDEHAA